MKVSAAMEQAILHQEYDKLPDALLVSLLRGYGCSKDPSFRKRCEDIQKLIDARGIDLDTFNGSTGFGAPRKSSPFP